jgi:uncharacterized membrane protein (DUF485 family)
MEQYINYPDKQHTVIELNNINKNINKLDRIIENTEDSNSCIDYIKKKKYEILFVIIITLLILLLYSSLHLLISYN